jgi:hypothetical protein
VPSPGGGEASRKVKSLFVDEKRRLVVSVRVGGTAPGWLMQSRGGGIAACLSAPMRYSVFLSVAFPVAPSSRTPVRPTIPGTFSYPFHFATHFETAALCFFPLTAAFSYLGGRKSTRPIAEGALLRWPIPVEDRCKGNKGPISQRGRQGALLTLACVFQPGCSFPGRGGDAPRGAQIDFAPA